MANSDEWSELDSRKVGSSPQKGSASKMGSPSKECVHGVIERVVETSDILFRMSVFEIRHYEVSWINLREEEYIAIYREKVKKYMK